MTKMLLAAAGSIAAIVLAADAAQAQNFSSSRHNDPFDGGVISPGLGACGDVRSFRRGHGRGDHGRDDDGRGNHGRGRPICSTDVVMSWYGGEWARWNNRSWEPTSYNDWWHEDRSRAYPAWMSRNQDCSRQWYSGDTLRC